MSNTTRYEYHDGARMYRIHFLMWKAEQELALAKAWLATV